MFKGFPVFELYFVFVDMGIYVLKSKIRRFLPEEFMETESGFITSGGFSDSIIEQHFNNLEMDS